MKLQASELTHANAATLLEVGRAAIGAGDLAFDLQSVRVVDSSAVALLLEWQRAAAARGGCIALSNVPPALASLITLYGVERLLGAAPAPQPSA